MSFGVGLDFIYCWAFYYNAHIILLYYNEYGLFSTIQLHLTYLAIITIDIVNVDVDLLMNNVEVRVAKKSLR